MSNGTVARVEQLCVQIRKYYFCNSLHANTIAAHRLRNSASYSPNKLEILMRLFVTLFALTAPIVAQLPSPVTISELMWSGSSVSSTDEWFELHNRSNATFDLSG